MHSPNPTARPSLGLSLRNIYETLAICVPTLVDAVRGRVTKELCDDRLEAWAAKVVRNLQIDLDVQGRENVPGLAESGRADAGRSYVVMSNHQSLYDIPVLFYVLGPNLRMIGKKELFAIPIFGHALELGGFISIDRSDRASAIASLDVARSVLANGTHVWIAPEGTRSKDGRLLPFKKGGFHLALRSGLPILPVSIDGTKDVLPARTARSRAGVRVRVTLHPPIETAPYAQRGKAGREALMNDVRGALASGLSGS